MLENLENIVGLSKSIELVPDDRMIWDEDDEMAQMHFVSTSGLIKEINYLAGDFLSQYLDEEVISVVTEVEFKHLKSIVVGERLIIGIRISELIANQITFKIIIMKDSDKVAEGIVKRTVVSRNYLRRKAIESI
ncbi:MAG: thioesterase [Fervidobacterium sp.]